MQSYPNCAGFIIFYQDSVVLVKTPRGSYSFPKGKRHKGETDLQTAFRETREESGISSEDINMIPDVHFDEMGKKSVSVRYFFAELKEKKSLQVEDPKELDSVDYIPIEKALKLEKLRTKRKEILQRAVDFHKKLNSQ